MAPAKSDQNGSNESAPPRQDQTDQDQGPTPSAKDTEQIVQPMEQEAVMAIVNPSKPILTSSEMAAFEGSSRLARSQ